MNWTGGIVVIFGIIYLIYSIRCRNKVTIYNQKKNMDIIKKEEFYKLQLNFSIFNSSYMIIGGVIIILCNMHSVYVFASIMLFYLVNYLFRLISERKGIIKFN